MKTLCFLPVLALLSGPMLHAEDKPATATGTTAPPSGAELTAFKTADDFWAYIEKLQEEPKSKALSREETVKMATDWLGNQQKAAEAFQKAYPNDPRRWTAAILELRALAKMRRVLGKAMIQPEDRPKIEAIVNSPDAPVTAKGEAAYMGVLLTTANFNSDKPETFAAFYKAAAEYIKQYPEHPLNARAKQMQLQVLNDDPSPAADELLKKLAEDKSDLRTAGVAKTTLERKQKMADLKSTPIDIKFTSPDGQEVDLAKLRGKVVLVDFWASWCGPCIAEMPNVVSTYSKLHEKGFEIVGISLDQDKAAMDAATKKHNMSWVQYFDGAGWENKISKGFGIQSIPAAWLIDKKGMLRETGLRGEALAAGVEKLLAEK